MNIESTYREGEAIRDFERLTHIQTQQLTRHHSVEAGVVSAVLANLQEDLALQLN